MTARGGSKGVPNKNLRLIGGLPLIAWKARAAYAAEAYRVVLSTDSPEIAAVGREHGCVALMRPASLATDTATSASVVRHALESLTMDGNEYDAVMLLEPSSPFTLASHYGIAISQMMGKSADLAVGMRQVDLHPTLQAEIGLDGSISDIVRKMRECDGKTRRQDFKPVWTISGSVYCFRVDMFLRTGDIYGGARNYGFLVDDVSGLEIDTMDDLAWAEYLVERGRVKPAPRPSEAGRWPPQ